MISLLNSHASVFYLLATIAVSWYVRHRGQAAIFAIIGAFSWYLIANGIYFITWLAMSIVEEKCSCYPLELESLLRVMGMQLASITVAGTFYSWTPIFSGRVFWHYFYLMVAVFVWCGAVWVYDVGMLWFATGHNAIYIGMLIALWNVQEEDNARSVR